ncbi:MAG: TIGR00180 family glycosyltransferase [Crocinitomicaceae bacterium]|nr:TIGR00180 family glycosyltransferase [Crocinitomicaceae bacterium]
MSKAKNYTVIIPTYNSRHHNLNRILEYFSPHELNIIIVDSSESPYPNEFNYQFKYLHVPGLGMYEKVYKSLESVTTPYVLLCADDDFIIPSGIATCIDFLDENPDYSSAQGNRICFTKSRLSVNFPDPDAAYDLDVNEESPLDRMTYHWTSFFVAYSVHRIQNFKETFKLGNEFTNDLFAVTTIERHLDFITLLNGKHRILPVFYQAREFERTSTGQTVTWESVKTGQPENYKKLVSKLAENLQSKLDLSFQECLDFIESLFVEKYVRKTAEADITEVKVPVKQKKMNKIPGIIKLKAFYSKSYYYFTDKYVFTLLRGVLAKKRIRRDKKGFPYSDELSNIEWQKIKAIIKKNKVAKS